MGADVAPMPDPSRVAYGHALTAMAVAIRRASAAIALLVALVALLVAPAQPLSVEAMWTGAFVAAAFVASRLLAVCIAALGWMVFPSDHRRLLADMASPGGING